MKEIKTRENVIAMIPVNHWFYQAIVGSINDIMNFYEQYPQYEYLSPADVFFILASIKWSASHGVKVYDFGDGNIGFVGTAITVENVPIAGSFPNIGNCKSFEDLLTTAKLIEVLK
jgi:hypothetical protein